MSTFPAGFVWGAATSGYQIEGGASADGKGESIWDRFVQKPGAILHGDTGDRACNTYDAAQLERDLDLIAALGLQAYIFSVQWPRIQPHGVGPALEKGLDYYRRLIDGLHKRGVMPVLTLYHWELPQALQDRGGWLLRSTVDRFVDYATLVHRAFAADVPVWVTQNEPYTSAWLGHAQGVHAPGLHSPAKAVKVAHHLMLSHGRAVQALRAQAAPHRNVFGPVLNLTPFRPATSRRAADRAAATQLDGEQNRFFLDAMFKGRYPQTVHDRFGGRDGALGFVKGGDMADIATPVDFLGVNYYMSQRVSAGADGQPHVEPAEGETTAMGWAVDPAGLHEVLVRVQREYTNELALIVSENGASFRDDVDPEGRCNDSERIDFLTRHLREAQRAIAHGVPLKAWFVWSLLDNFEWNSGYRERFGLVHVDYASQKRTPKSSFDWYRGVIARNGLDKAATRQRRRR